MVKTRLSAASTNVVRTAVKQCVVMLELFSITMIFFFAPSTTTDIMAN